MRKSVLWSRVGDNMSEREDELAANAVDYLLERRRPIFAGNFTSKVSFWTPFLQKISVL